MYPIIYITNKESAVHCILTKDNYPLRIYAQCNCNYVQDFKKAYKADLTEAKSARLFVRSTRQSKYENSVD